MLPNYPDFLLIREANEHRNLLRDFRGDDIFIDLELDNRQPEMTIHYFTDCADEPAFFLAEHKEYDNEGNQIFPDMVGCEDE